MFEPSPAPRVFGLPPGVDFPAELIAGLRARLGDQPPEAMARVQLIVNTRRMARRIRALFDEGPPGFLPKISLLTDLGGAHLFADIPDAMSPLRRRLELAQLIDGLLSAQPDLAARTSLFDLADSLAALLDEMQGEGVGVADIRALDVTDMSGHWERAKTFIGIVEQYLGATPDRIDPQARQRQVVQRLSAHWRELPPADPIILAGSTGSRGTTMLLMQAIAQLPNGAVVLPGFDFAQPASVWQQMSDALVAEDHPQFRFSRVMASLEIAPEQIRRWTPAAPPSPPRNALVSLALRPAPFTDAWLEEGPALDDLPEACGGVTLVEAPGPKEEATAIALRLRKAAEDWETAALITPDRMLTRRVAAALDRWGILPDDSAGLPLQLSPPGRFLRHLTQVFAHRVTGETLLTVLKHPLCHTGDGRGDHLRFTRELELHLRKKGPPFPDAVSMQAFAARHDTVPPSWISWVTACCDMGDLSGERPLSEWVATLRRHAETLASGSLTEGSGALWDKKAGEKALSVMESLEQDAPFGGEMSARTFSDLIATLLSGEEVRDRDAPHPDILIWGTLEARVQGADLLILGGLNEGSWPESAPPDPWLNRKLRLDAGLLLPERRIGLSAHDFQQAIAAKSVFLTRSEKSDEAETVPSRWLNRTVNLLSGLKPEGQEALADMRRRGAHYLALAEAYEAAPPLLPAPRPSPKPPVEARPKQLSVTEIKRLIRDPYAIYARHVLGLRSLDPIAKEPDALLRGNVVHDVLEAFVRESFAGVRELSEAALLDIAQGVLGRDVPWPMAQRLWLARLARVAADFLDSERNRQQRAESVTLETQGMMQLAPLDFRLVGRADRIDRTADGRLTIYDYKTGAAPSRAVQQNFDKQLLIEAAMASQGAFDGLDAAYVARAVFIGLGSGGYSEVAAPLDEEPPEKIIAELRDLIGAYLSKDQGFTARRAMQKDSDPGDYDHLARFGEWDRSAQAEPEDLA